MSGNGEYIPGHAGTTLIPAFDGLGSEPIVLAPGYGGGCVTTGPFKNMTVNLGPIALPNITVGPDGGLGYNPRCLKRDVGPAVATKYTNYTAVLETLVTKDIASFQWQLQGTPGQNTIGPHGGGHYTIRQATHYKSISIHANTGTVVIQVEIYSSLQVCLFLPPFPSGAFRS